MKRPTGRGQTYERGTPGFDDKVLSTSFNRRDPGRRPSVLVEANDISEVVNALARARRENLKVSVVSGGHSWNQNHLRDGSLLLSMARFNKVEVNPDNKTATVEPGVWALDLDKAVRKHDLFFPVTHVVDVCMGGFLLQGGFGWGSTKVGPATMSVIGVDVVLADGSVVYADENENPDIYWAARGSGPGFFAVVVRWHLKLYPRHKFSGMKIQVFRKQHMDELYRWAERIGPEVSNLVELQLVMGRKSMGINAPGVEVIAPVLADSRQEAKEAVDFISKSPLRKKASFTTPLIPAPISWMMQFATRMLFPPTAHWCTDNMWLDAPLEKILPELRNISETLPPAPSHSLWLNWNPGKQPARPDMAFGMEAQTYMAIYGEWQDAADDAKYANWATERMKALEPYAKGIQLADENLAKRPARFTTDEKLVKLDRLREKYDPDGLFNPWGGRIALPAGE
jgi:FAD/FMN-containing dehydrogenase